MLRFSKILVANRGEIANRIIRTTKNMGIKSVALFNDIDKYSSYVKNADEAVFVSGNKSVFLDVDEIISIAKRYHADAIHPGYGFLSENPEFSKQCEENGIKFVGPSSATMKLLSSKKDAKELAHQCGIPVVPGYSGSDQSNARLVEEIERIGYPVLVKASMGGGGRGMRILMNDTHINEVISSCRNEAERHFGDSCLLVEKYLPRTHHLEVQVFGDAHGNVIHFGERECSLQRRYQKIIEEAPCFYITNEERNQLYKWALELVKKSHYEGAATVEFLCDAATRKFYFMEVNTRLQVEHMVTQCINQQLDLVELQLRIAQGESLKDIGVVPFSMNALNPNSLPSIYKKGPNCGRFSMECRVYNEDPENNYLPGEGLAQFSNLVGDDDHTIIENNVPSSASATSFDPMLLKVITTGETRNEVLHRMENALRRCAVIGVPTNIQMLVNALHLEKFQKEGADSRTVEEYAKELTESRELSDFEIGFSVANYLYSQSQNCHFNNPWSHLTSFSNSISLTRFGSVLINGKPFDYRMESNQLSVRYPGEEWKSPISVECLSSNNEEVQLRVNDELVRCVVQKEGDCVHLFPMSAIDHFASVRYDVAERTPQSLSAKSSSSSATLSTVVSPMPGSVSRVLAKNGDRVKKGDIIVVLEAMKMEHSITAPCDGVLSISELSDHQFLKKGQAIFRVEYPFY